MTALLAARNGFEVMKKSATIVAGGLALALMALVSYISIDRLYLSAEAVIAVDNAKSEVDRIRGSVAELETATRGYLLTGDLDYLASIRAMRSDIEIHERVLSTIREDAIVRKILPNLQADISRHLMNNEMLLQAAQLHGPAAARQLFGSTDEPRVHRDLDNRLSVIRSRFEAIEQGQQDSLRRLVPISAGVIISFFAIIAAAIMFARSMQQKAMLARQRYQRMTELSPDAILVARNRRIAFVNPSAEKLLNRPSPRIVGMEIGQVFEPAGLFATQHLAELEAEPTKVRSAQDRLKSGDGQHVDVDISAVSYFDHGSLELLIKARDIRDQLHLERQLQEARRLEALGRLTGGIAHDFNNLLTVIIGGAETLQEQLHESDDDTATAVSIINRAADQASSLVTHLLAFARRQPLRPRVTDVSQMTKALVPMLQRTLGEQVDIEVKGELGGSLAIVDPTLLESAVVNLAINARDAMPDGGVLTIETINVELDEDYVLLNHDVRPGRYVQLSVCDSGAGIPPEIIDRVFEPFFTTKQSGGTGLGLSSVYGFARQTGGHAKIYSEIGLGTCVKIYIPVAPVGSAIDSEPGYEQLAARGSGLILFVEDDTLVREHVTRQLCSLGYRVKAVKNADEAIEALEQGKFDLLFTDAVLPGKKGGRHVAEQAGRLRPGMPVLFTSGYTENGIVRNGILDPGVRLLQKPFRKKQLADAVREAMLKKPQG